MTVLPPLIPHLADLAERYLTLERVHPTGRYNYAARGFHNLEVIETKQHAPKCKLGESWLYIAFPAEAGLRSLASQDRLYVGAQTQDRMFRGDGLDGTNFHHAEMRAGNGVDNPVAFLRSGRQVAIYRVPASDIALRVQNNATLEPLRILLSQPLTKQKHLSWWFEQYVLFAERGQWRWNTAPAHKSMPKLFA